MNEWMNEWKIDAREISKNIDSRKYIIITKSEIFCIKYEIREIFCLKNRISKDLIKVR